MSKFFVAFKPAATQETNLNAQPRQSSLPSLTVGLLNGLRPGQ